MTILAPHRLAILFASLLSLLVSVSPAAPASTTVTGIRYWSSPSYTRVVIDLDRDVRYEADFLPADPGTGLPPRIFLDIVGAEIRE
ncbi:MAG TPA: hypothetical protein VIS30_05180, partial [Candidatus Deferrimicrobiaceae bacterium]